MKKNIVIIAGTCYPKNSATGGLALKFAEFLREDCNIRLIAIQDGQNVAKGLPFKNTRVYTLTQWRLLWAQNAQKKMRESNGAKRIFYKFSYTIARIVGRIQSMFFTLDNAWWYQRKALALLKKMDKEEKIDNIISFSNPIEAHIAAIKFKKIRPSVNVSCFWCDLFAVENQKLNVFVSLKKMRSIETRINSFADHVLCTDEVYDVLSKREPKDIVKKMIAIPYVLKENVLARDNSVSIVEGEYINCVYMGSFYRSIRNPEYMLKMFASSKNRFCVLHLYSQGDCDDIVEKYKKIAPDKIVDHGIVTIDELDAILRDAHLLINIENTLSTTVPSKILELMSYRKRIINIKKSLMSSTIPTEYPLVLNIDNDTEADKVWDQIEKFLYNGQKDVLYDFMYQKFYRHTEDNVKKLVLKTLEDKV